MGALKMFPVATNRAQSSGPCAKRVLGAEIECGAFMSAINQLFGEEVARTAVSLWVEELEAGPNHFRGRDSDWRVVTISAASRLADLMGTTCSTEKPHYGGDEDSEARLTSPLSSAGNSQSPTEYRSSHHSSRLVTQIKVESDVQ
jgi:hypothetical protein